MNRILIVVSMMIVACNPLSKTEEEQSGSTPSFVESFQGSTRCGYRYALQPTINICVQPQAGVSSENTEKHKNLSRRALLEWLDVLRPMNQNVTQNIEFNCDRNALTMNIMPGKGRSFARPGEINVYQSTDLGTQLHEWGHAFACLGDAYMGSQAGRCMPGQPESIMCWGEYGKDALYEDDKNGLAMVFTRNFHKVFRPPSGGASSGVTPGNIAASDGSIGASNQVVQKDLKIKVLRGLASSSKNTMLVSAPVQTSNMYACVGAFYNECDAATHGSVKMRKLTTLGLRKLYLVSFSSADAANQKIVIEGVAGNDQPIVRRKFMLKGI